MAGTGGRMLEFIVYLYREGVLDAVEGMAVLDRALQRREPIGRIAVREGILTVKEVVKVLEAQAGTSPRVRFGEAAVRLGFMTQGDLEWMLRNQERCAGGDPVVVLAELTGLTEERLRDLHRRFGEANAQSH